jgi:hypothetical protein
VELQRVRTAVLGHLSDFSSVIAENAALLLATLAIFVPALTLAESQDHLAVLANVAIGITCVLPITSLVWKADQRAHTKWFLGELFLILATAVVFSLQCSHTFHRGTSAGISRFLAYTTFAVSITLPLLQALCRRNFTEGDGWRTYLLIMTGVGQAFFEGLQKFSSSIGFQEYEGTWPVLVSLCALFVIGMFYADHGKKIEHSVPYAVAYSWALSASIINTSYMLGLWHQYGELLSDAADLRSTVLASQITLTIFSAVVLWVFSQVSGRITTARDRSSFMLPGFFVVVRCAETTNTKILALS